MIENSSAGLVLLEAEVTVTVTREEQHQRELARYAVTAGQERYVAVELGWCTIGSGKFRGHHAIEVRLDGYRVGELTYLMSQRYAPLVTQVTDQGGRPGCQATLQLGARGLEVTLGLPRSGAGVVPVGAPVLPQQQRKPFWKRPMWIAAAAVVFVLFIASLADDDEETPSSDAAADRTTTTSAAPTTTTTTTPPPTTTTTTTVVPAPPPVVVDPVETVTEEPAPPPPPAPEPEPACDPNYSGCVPVASDVDCAGGSGNGPAYVDGPVQVIGSDIYELDRDGDGTACDG